MDSHGGTEVLYYGDAPDPVAGPGEIVVDIHAASVNGADPKVRKGGGVYTLKKFPHILGRDFSGIVSALGTGVSDFKVGDAVFGVTDVGIEGAYAEKIAIKETIVCKKPETLSHAEAAALGLVSLTALIAIEDTAHLKSGETILIQGGAGGVAGFAVQFAKHIGATVITTASKGNHDYLRGLGADRIIDYHTEDFTGIGPVCDVVFDTVGGSVRPGCYTVLKPGGRMIWISPTPEGFVIPRDDVTTVRPNVARDRAHLQRMLDLVAAGAIQKPEMTHFALADAAEAHTISDGRHLRGKLVFDVRS
jgi:NADPH:quinone reductase-like Zn-dependent oxidoreductase